MRNDEAGTSSFGTVHWNLTWISLDDLLGLPSFNGGCSMYSQSAKFRAHASVMGARNLPGLGQRLPAYDSQSAQLTRSLLGMLVPKILSQGDGKLLD